MRGIVRQTLQRFDDNRFNARILNAARRA